MALIVAFSEYTPLSNKTVAISGCFDIIHIGHIRFIEAARKQGDALIILLESDTFIEKYKNRQPFHSQQERAEVLSHIREVDCVVLLPFMIEELAYEDMWKKIRPAVIAVTQGDSYLEKKKQQALEIGASVVEVAPLVEGKSTTSALTFDPSREVIE